MEWWDKFKEGAAEFGEAALPYLVPGVTLAREGWNWLNAPAEEAERRAGEMMEKIPDPVDYGQIMEYFQPQLRGLAESKVGPGHPAYEAHLRASRGDVENIMRRRGQAYGGSAAARGALSGSTYGSAARGRSEAQRTEGAMMDRARSSAMVQAEQQVASQFDRLFRQAGFEGGLLDKNFEQKFRALAFELNLTEMEIQAQLASRKALIDAVSGTVKAIAASQ